MSESIQNGIYHISFGKPSSIKGENITDITIENTESKVIHGLLDVDDSDAPLLASLASLKIEEGKDPKEIQSQLEGALSLLTALKDVLEQKYLMSPYVIEKILEDIRQQIEFYSEEWKKENQ